MSEKCHSILPRSNGRLLAHIASVSIDLNHRQVIPEHYHPEDQLIFASRGVMIVSARQGIWVVPPLRAVWIPAGTPHSVEMCGQVSMRTLYFHPGMVRALPQRCFVMNISALLRELILHACELSTLTRRIALQRSLIDVMIAQLKTANAVPLQLPRPEDMRAARIVRSLLADPSANQTLDQLCKACGASKRTIQRIFLTETKMSFARWRQQLKLLHALQLLATGEKVTAAALEAGYNSPSAFISMFRKQLGTTPMAYFKERG
jgi:AraC-like DNA-binding protein